MSMGSALWKRFEQSAPVRRTKLRLRQLIGRELRLRPTVRLSTVMDGGWCYDASRLAADSVVYSLGVGDDVDFDLGLIRRSGATVYAFDPTPGCGEALAARALPCRFHFHPWGAAGRDGTLTLFPRMRRNGSLSDGMYTLIPDQGSENRAIDVPAYTVSSLTRLLGHRCIDLLKIDIEGAEYAVIDSLLMSALRPRQILVEFHHRHDGISKESTSAAVADLASAGYRPFYVSNDVREVSFLHGT